MVRPLNTAWWDVHSVRMWGSAHTDSWGTIYPGEGELDIGLWSGGKPVGEVEPRNMYKTSGETCFQSIALAEWGNWTNKSMYTKNKEEKETEPMRIW